MTHIPAWNQALWIMLVIGFTIAGITVYAFLVLAS
jgi:hypothetical protein